MENWGLITYRTTAVLFDEYASDQRYKNRVVYVRKVKVDCLLTFLYSWNTVLDDISD